MEHRKSLAELINYTKTCPNVDNYREDVMESVIDHVLHPRAGDDNDDRDHGEVDCDERAHPTYRTSRQGPQSPEPASDPIYIPVQSEDEDDDGECELVTQMPNLQSLMEESEIEFSNIFEDFIQSASPVPARKTVEIYLPKDAGGGKSSAIRIPTKSKGKPASIKGLKKAMGIIEKKVTFKKSQFNKKPKANKFALENFVKKKW